jgi:hypothetical protein
MSNHETVQPLSSGEIFDFAAAVMQQLPRDLDPSRIRHFLRSKKELGAGLRELCARPLIGDVVQVNRAERVIYPEWVDGVLHPDLAATGPAEYTLDSLEQWLHDGQKNGGHVVGSRIYEHLKGATMLEDCLGLSDLLAIQKLGLDTFRRHFKDRVVFGWKSVVRDRAGDLDVPYLVERGGRVNLDWRWLDVGWRGRGPALRFGK